MRFASRGGLVRRVLLLTKGVHVCMSVSMCLCVCICIDELYKIVGCIDLIVPYC